MGVRIPRPVQLEELAETLVGNGIGLENRLALRVACEFESHFLRNWRGKHNGIAAAWKAVHHFGGVLVRVQFSPQIICNSIYYTRTGIVYM